MILSKEAIISYTLIINVTALLKLCMGFHVGSKTVLPKVRAKIMIRFTPHLRTMKEGIFITGYNGPHDHMEELREG